MAKIEVKGAIVSSEDKWIYDYLGMDAVCPKDVERALAEAAGDAVTVEVNSGGGEIFAASEIFYSLQKYPGQVTADIVGFAGSAATVICCGANRVRAVPTAMYMIHNVSGSADGDHQVMSHTAEVLKNASKAIAAAYQQKTGLSQNELLALMDKESWMTAEVAKEKGFIDEIIESPAPSNKLYNAVSGVLSPDVIAKMRNKVLMQNKLHLLKLKGDMRHV